MLNKLSFLLIISLLIFFIGLPLLTILSQAVTLEGQINLTHALPLILAQDNLQTIINSLLLGVAGVGVATIIALPLAFLLSKTSFGRWPLLDIVLMIPFMTPPYILSMGWILFCQRRGFFQQLFTESDWLEKAFFSFWGLVLVMSLHVFPFMLSILKNALFTIHPNLEENGAMLGGGFFYRLRKITLPLISGNYAIGALLVFVKILSEYGTPATLGQRIGFYVFTTDIHRYATTSPINFGKAAGLASVLILICMVMWCIQSHITSRRQFNLISGKGGYQALKPLTGLKSAFACAYLGFILIIAIILPYFAIISTSLIKLRAYGLAANNLTIDHYIALLSGYGQSALSNSTLLGLTSATLAAILGTVIVIVIRQLTGTKAKVIELAGVIPEMLPSIVIVLGIMIFWNKIYTLWPLYNSFAILILTYVILYLPYTIQMVSSAFSQMNNNLIAAGRILAPPYYVLQRVTLPLIAKGLLAAWMLTFIITFRELVAATLLAPSGTLTVSSFIMREFEQGSVSIGMAMAVVGVLLSSLILIIFNAMVLKNSSH